MCSEMITFKHFVPFSNNVTFIENVSEKYVANFRMNDYGLSDDEFWVRVEE